MFSLLPYHDKLDTVSGTCTLLYGFLCALISESFITLTNHAPFNRPHRYATPMSQKLLVSNIGLYILTTTLYLYFLSILGYLERCRIVDFCTMALGSFVYIGQVTYYTYLAYTKYSYVNQPVTLSREAD